MKDAKLNPTLFDKLTLSDRVTSILDEGRSELQDINSRAAARQTVDLDAYTESALRASVRRELSWLLNTVNFAVSEDLSRTPHVKTSVLNYGLPDVTGRVSTSRSVQARAREMEEAIAVFEPRLDPTKLRVEVRPEIGLDNAIGYIIHGDVVAAVQAIPVQFFASVEVETGEAVVKE